MKQYLERIREQTRDNDHTGALITIARYVCKKHNQLESVELLIKYGEAIEALHGFYGYMPSHLKQMRDEYKSQLFSLLDQEETTAFNNVL